MADAVRRIPPVKGDDPVAISKAFRHLDFSVKGMDKELDQAEEDIVSSQALSYAFSWMGF